MVNVVNYLSYHRKQQQNESLVSGLGTGHMQQQQEVQQQLVEKTEVARSPGSFSP